MSTIRIYQGCGTGYIRVCGLTKQTVTKQRHLVIITNVLLFVILGLFRAVCQDCVRIWKRAARALIGLGHSSTILVRIKASTSCQCSTRGQWGLQLLASERGCPSGCLVHVMDSPRLYKALFVCVVSWSFLATVHIVYTT